MFTCILKIISHATESIRSRAKLQAKVSPGSPILEPTRTGPPKFCLTCVYHYGNIRVGTFWGLIGTCMYDGVGVWRREIVWRFKMRAPTPPIPYGLAFILKSLEQVLTNIHGRILAFLTGSGSQTECDVTHSKQTIAQFLTGARTHIKESESRGIFAAFLYPVYAILANFSSITASRLCTIFF